MPDAEEWITTEEAAEISGYHVNHIRRMIHTNHIKARKFGPVWQVHRPTLLRYIKSAEESGDKRRGPK